MEVTFEIDANGIMNVSAKDKGTGKTQQITITASSGLTKDEVDKMVKDADANRAEDEKRKELIEAKNQLDNLTYQMEKMKNENKEKMPPEDVAAVEGVVKEAREIKEKAQTKEEIEQVLQKINQVSSKVAQNLYKTTAQEPPKDQGASGQPQGGAEAGAPNGAEAPANEGEVIDAEFEDAK